MTATPYDGPPMTAREVAEAVAEDLGITPDEAAGMVQGYLDETSERVGVPVDDWTLDEADVDAITTSAAGTTATATAVAEATAAVAAAQGRTVDAASSVVSDSTDATYVGLSRGQADSDEHVEADAG